MTVLLEQYVKELIIDLLDEAKRKKKKSKKGKRGLWDNVWAKRARGGKPAKTRAQGRPDHKTWKQLTGK